jgi:hypothetical protein
MIHRNKETAPVKDVKPKDLPNYDDRRGPLLGLLIEADWMLLFPSPLIISFF